jgi:hypothetical protein
MAVFKLAVSGVSQRSKDCRGTSGCAARQERRPGWYASGSTMCNCTGSSGRIVSASPASGVSCRGSVQTAYPRYWVSERILGPAP